MSALQIEQECRRVGAQDIRSAAPLKQVVCDLEDSAMSMLSAIPGIIIRAPKIITMEKVTSPMQAIGVPEGSIDIGYVAPPRSTIEQAEVLQPVYAASQGSLFTMLFQLREMLTPPVLGTGVTVVIIDTGIRSTHIGLRGKVVYEEDMTGGGDPSDVFDHGTGVAYLYCGGAHAPGQESGIAPGAKLMNLKTIGDEGSGSEEDLILAIARTLELWQEAVDAGLPISDDMYPNAINMSLGADDDDDPDGIIRLAVTEVWETAGNRLIMYAAAGNEGPDPGTILLPGACAEVWAVGAMVFNPFSIWEDSSRGPVTLGNLTKPDTVSVGVSILTASSAHDNAFTVKTGTSFATPIAIGFSALLAEYAFRYGMEEQYLAMDRQGWEALLIAVSRKPVGSLFGKDNTYGMGMVMGDLAVRNLGLAAGATPDLLTGMMTVGMMGMMMKTMTI